MTINQRLSNDALEKIKKNLSEEYVEESCDLGSLGWDLEQAIKIKMDYNKTRSHRHGGKKF